jgi:hypothetical protein
MDAAIVNKKAHYAKMREIKFNKDNDDIENLNNVIEKVNKQEQDEI